MLPICVTENNSTRSSSVRLSSNEADGSHKSNEDDVGIHLGLW